MISGGGGRGGAGIGDVMLLTAAYPRLQSYWGNQARTIWGSWEL